MATAERRAIQPEPVQPGSNPECTPAFPPECLAGVHRLPLLNTATYNAVPGWEGYGECSGCDSTVHRDSLAAGANTYPVPAGGGLFVVGS